MSDAGCKPTRIAFLLADLKGDDPDLRFVKHVIGMTTDHINDRVVSFDQYIADIDRLKARIQRLEEENKAYRREREHREAALRAELLRAERRYQ